MLQKVSIMHLSKKQVIARAGRYDGIIVIPRYVNSPILIPKLILPYDFIAIVINIIVTYAVTVAELGNGGVAHDYAAAAAASYLSIVESNSESENDAGIYTSLA